MAQFFSGKKDERKKQMKYNLHLITKNSQVKIDEYNGGLLLV